MNLSYSLLYFCYTIGIYSKNVTNKKITEWGAKKYSREAIASLEPPSFYGYAHDWCLKHVINYKKIFRFILKTLSIRQELYIFNHEMIM